jgi:hypothetical protein
VRNLRLYVFLPVTDVSSYLIIRGRCDRWKSVMKSIIAVLMISMSSINGPSAWAQLSAHTKTCEAGASRQVGSRNADQVSSSSAHRSSETGSSSTEKAAYSIRGTITPSAYPLAQQSAELLNDSSAKLNQFDSYPVFVKESKRDSHLQHRLEELRKLHPESGSAARELYITGPLANF